LRKAVGNETAGGELVEAELGVLMNRLSPRLHRGFVGDESINGIHGSIIGFAVIDGRQYFFRDDDQR